MSPQLGVSLVIVNQLFHDLLSRSYVCHSVRSVKTADNFTSAKRDESFWVMFTEPYYTIAVVSLVIGHEINTLQRDVG